MSTLAALVLLAVVLPVINRSDRERGCRNVVVRERDLHRSGGCFHRMGSFHGASLFAIRHGAAARSARESWRRLCEDRTYERRACSARRRASVNPSEEGRG